MRSRGLGWLGRLVLALVAGSCTSTTAPSDTVTVRSAVNSNVVVTVVNDTGSPQFDVEVMAQQNGSFVASAWTNAQGQATLSLAAGSYRFATHDFGVYYYSGAAGHCTTPACTTASITQTHVDLTVLDTNGTPQAGLLVTWIDTAGNQGAYVDTGANGHALVSVPPASYRFKVSQNGLAFYSGAAGHCTVPSCTTASITTTVPVTVTVTDTAGAPIANTLMVWENAAGDAGAWTNTNANGIAQVSVPPGSTRFKVNVDGTNFYSSAGFACVVPGCTAASISVSTPTVVTVVNGSGAPINNRQVTPLSDEGLTVNAKNTNASGQVTFRLLFPGHWRFKAKCSGNNETFYSGNAGHCYVPGLCATAKIKMPCGQCAGKPNGFACDDQTACSGSSTCQSQFCTGANPMSCSASDQCHDAGACGAETGTCSNPPKANGTSCNDSDACSQTDTCQSGTCTGSNPVTCTAQDACHDVGVCAPATGQCSNPLKPAGTSCGTNMVCNAGGQCVPNNQAPVANAGADQTVQFQAPPPQPNMTLQRISTAFNNPVGIDYHPPTNKMLLSVNYGNGQPHNFELINPDGSHQTFSNISGFTDEVYFTIARDEGGGHSLGGFTAGEVLTGTGAPGNIARVSPDGATVVNPWVHLPNETGLLRGQLHLDRTGIFGGDLIATTTTGHVWRVTAAGATTLLATAVAGEIEALETVPNDPDRYGPWAGKILVGGEDTPTIYAVDTAGQVTTYQIGIRPENINVVPLQENFYGVDFGGGAIYGASASQFKDMVGDIVMSEEFGGKLWHVHWNGSEFIKIPLAQVTQWEHTAFAPASMVEITSPTVEVALSGSASDDGLPSGSTLTVTWSVASGPGPVTFGDIHALSTTARFGEPGTYVLVLTASDGTLTTSDQLTVVVTRISPHNTAPVVDAGPDQTVALPAFAVLSGSANDDGIPAGGAISLSWSQVSGPANVAFVNSTAGLSGALFDQPGTYVLKLTASDGELSASDQVTISVLAEPSLDGANLAISVASAGPLQIGSLASATATLTNALAQPISSFPVKLTVTGANPLVQTLDTDANGAVTFVYRGDHAGTDALHATALGLQTSIDSATVSIAWTDLPIGGPILTQGWIGSPVDSTLIMERVPVVLAPGITLTSGTLFYWPASTPSDVHTLASGLSGGPGTVLGTFDTTLLANDTYILHLQGTSNTGLQKSSEIAVTVTGEYKPGRVVVELTDFTVPIAGLPLTIGRRYDSLEKDRVGDFGHGWSLLVGHPRLEVAPNFTVSLELPDGRRASFFLTLQPPPLSIFGAFFPVYQAEPGVFGKLTQEGGCPLVGYNPSDPANPLPCFFTFGFATAYAPEFYTYTDPYGTAYRMAASGEIKSITDRQGNSLTFTANGIVSSTGKSVTFVRDAQGRILHVDYPAYFGGSTPAAQYTYDSSGDLATVELPPSGNGPSIFLHTYAEHRLLTSVDPRGNPARTSTYGTDGRLATDKDALNNVTTYAYDLGTRTTTTTYPDTGVVTQVFDPRGLMLSETDQLGHTTTHLYDADRNETSRTNAAGEVTTATYDDGNQTSRTDPKGPTYTTYNADNQPITFVDRLEHTTTIDYDEHGVPSRVADEIGTRFSFTNSEHGLPITVDDAEGHHAHLTYDVAGNLTSRTDWIGRVTQATYDEAGHRLSETTARGNTTAYTYHLQGWLNTTTQSDGYFMQNAYDPNGNLLFSYDSPRLHTQINPTFDALNHLTQIWRVDDGTTVNYTRDFRGNPLTMTDENGHVTTYEYDHTGNLTKTTFADGRFTTRTYDALNRLATLTDERGNTTTYEYDPGCGCSDRVTRVTDPLGHATVTAYDANGRRSSVTDANSHTTSFAYNVRGQVIETDYPDGTSTHESYDARGRRISTTDQTGGVTLYGYDDQGQLTSVTDPASNVTSYAYDPDGNLKSVTDANGHTTSYEYDLFKRKIKRTLPLSQVETFAYNSVGNETSHTDFRGKTTTMTYDHRDRMLTKVPDPFLGEASQSYSYSPTGMRTSMTDGSGTTMFTYDLLDRMLTKAATAGTLTYTYDSAGNVETIVSSNANGTSVRYTWDGSNQLVAVTDLRLGQPGVGVSTTATHTPTRRPATLAQPNGVGLTYSYDSLDRVTSMLWRQGTSPAFGSWAYGHNLRGQRTSSTDITGRNAAYGYDGASRLTSEVITADPRGASFNGALSYVLDGAGNRLSRASTLAVLGAQSFTYNANDEISGDTFDANGNTTSSGGHTYAYDFENRLVSKDGGAVTLTYNCEGDRVAKTIGGVTTRYLVDDLNPTGYLQMLEEVVGSVVQTRYTYGTSIVSQTRNVSSTPATSYYGFDAHGNITFLTDATGAVTDAYDYDGWGILVASTGSTPNIRLYVGEEFDPDLGLINLRARQYKPELGRFLTVDPLMGAPMRPLALNRHLYAEADPTNRTDPLGLTTDVEYGLKTTAVAGAGAAQTSVTVVGTGTATGAIGAATIETSAVRVVSVLLSCALIKGSGASTEDVAFIAFLTRNPLWVALVVCAAPKMDCTKIKNDICIPECRDSYLPSKRGDVAPFFKCIADCLLRHGCSPHGTGSF